MSRIEYFAADEAATGRFGGWLADQVKAPAIVYLEGDLGAGKTTLSRAWIQALGHRGAVRSPTYTLVEPYEGTRVPLYHFDLYRLGDPEELEAMGLRDYLGEGALCLFEWPQRGEGVLPDADWRISLTPQDMGRKIVVETPDAVPEREIERLKSL
ncbi:MAG: tRNA (adenosine(37)-N6)-threonylcarbamoyltransferase complex ATPase subunit type 1 TsaE [Pseudomonadota bacterium]